MPKLFDKITSYQRRLFVMRTATEGTRIRLERRFANEFGQYLQKLQVALSRLFIDEGTLRLAQRQAFLIKKLPYKERDLKIRDVLEDVFNPMAWRDLQYTKESRNIAAVYRKWVRVMYDMGAVTSLRMMGIRATSPVLDRFEKRIEKSKAVSFESLVFELSDDEVLYWLDNRAYQFGKGIAEETIKEARRLVGQEIYRGNATIQEVAMKMKGVNEARALRIARTETQQAFNTASYDMHKRSGVKTHQWWAVGDTRTRPEHNFNDGAVVKVGEPFPSGQLHPGEGANSINCRCSVTPDLSSADIMLEPWTGKQAHVPRDTTYKPKPRPKRKPRKKPEAAPQEATTAKEAQDFEKLRTEILADLEKDATYLEYLQAKEDLAAANSTMKNNPAYKKCEEIRDKLARWRRPDGTIIDSPEARALQKEVGKYRDEVIELISKLEKAEERANGLLQEVSKKVQSRLKTAGEGFKVSANVQTGGSKAVTTEFGEITTVNVTKAVQSKIDEAVAFIDDISSGQGLVTESIKKQALTKLDDVIGAIDEVETALRTGGPSPPKAIERQLKAYLNMLKEERVALQAIADGEAGTNINIFQTNKIIRAHKSEYYMVGPNTGDNTIDYILIHKDNAVDAIIHEISHAIEDGYHARSARAFFKHRAAPNSNVFPNVIIKNGELYHPDDFLHHYQGRIYLQESRHVTGRFLAGDGTVRGTEIHSIYIERLYHDPMLLMQQDPEGFIYIMESLNGVPLEQQTWFRLLPRERQRWLLIHDDFATAGQIPLEGALPTQ